jgi:hypothetical protein
MKPPIGRNGVRIPNPAPDAELPSVGDPGGRVRRSGLATGPSFPCPIGNERDILRAERGLQSTGRQPGEGPSSVFMAPAA